MKNREIPFDEIWNDKKKAGLKDFIDAHSAKQSKEELVTNRLLSIQYKLEDYIQNENEDEEVLKILDFVKMYLKALNVTKKRLATYFDMRDSNLQKYLSGERKLNADVALKLSAFSHTKPEHWYSVQVKNELIELKKKKRNIAAYEKYDYRNLLEL